MVWTGCATSSSSPKQIHPTPTRTTCSALNATSNGVDELRYLFIVSQAELVDSAEPATACQFSEAFNGDAAATPGATATAAAATATAGDSSVGDFAVGVSRASGAKCARCWNYCGSVGRDTGHPELCERCTPVVADLGFTPAAATAPVAA